MGNSIKQGKDEAINCHGDEHDKEQDHYNDHDHDDDYVDLHLPTFNHLQFV